MLARVAENLYWMGRQIERVDFCNRYTSAQYFTSLSAPMSGHKDFILRSILFINGSSLNPDDPITENAIWKNIIFSPDNPSSFFSTINNSRENARSIKNALSTELWESINKWYLFCKERGKESFKSSDLFWFSEHMVSHIALIKSSMVNTIVHDDVWHFLNLGMLVERSHQILKIIRSKISDSAILSNAGELESLKLYQWAVMLRTVGAFDVHHKLNSNTVMSNETIFKLILSNYLFPRSIKFASHKIHKHLNLISVKTPEVHSLITEVHDKLNSCNDFGEFGNEEAVIEHIEDLTIWTNELHFKIQDLFFPKR